MADQQHEIERLLTMNRDLWRQVNEAMRHLDPQLPTWPRPRSLKQARAQASQLREMVDEICRQARMVCARADEFFPKGQ